jgi:hypothetical protein
MATSATDIYTAPSLTTTIVKQIMLCNTDASTARTATLHVAASGSVAAGNTIFKAISLDPNETVILNLSLVIKLYFALADYDDDKYFLIN